MHEDDREDAKFEGICAIALPNMKRCKIEAKKSIEKMVHSAWVRHDEKKKPASSQLIGKRENGEKRTKRSATGASHAAFDGCTQIVVVRFAVHSAIRASKLSPSFRVAFGIVSSRPQRNLSRTYWPYLSLS